MIAIAPTRAAREFNRFEIARCSDDRARRAKDAEISRCSSVNTREQREELREHVLPPPAQSPMKARVHHGDVRRSTDLTSRRE